MQNHRHDKAAGAATLSYHMQNQIHELAKNGEMKPREIRRTVLFNAFKNQHDYDAGDFLLSISQVNTIFFAHNPRKYVTLSVFHVLSCIIHCHSPTST